MVQICDLLIAEGVEYKVGDGRFGSEVDEEIAGMSDDVLSEVESEPGSELCVKYGMAVGPGLLNCIFSCTKFQLVFGCGDISLAQTIFPAAKYSSVTSSSKFCPMLSKLMSPISGASKSKLVALLKSKYSRLQGSTKFCKQDDDSWSCSGPYSGYRFRKLGFKGDGKDMMK